MKQENQLERKSKEFDWKEWTPIVGLYFVPRNILKGRASRSLDGNFSVAVNVTYHSAVSVFPIFYTIGKIIAKYL